MNDLQILRQDVDRLTRQVSEMGGLNERTALGAESPVEPLPIPPATAVPPASNSIRAGDISHSVNTWFEAVAAPGTDKVLEAAWWYSTAGPAAAGQALSFINALTSSVNDTLKAVGHSTYDGTRCDWGLPAGIARMTGLSVLNAPFPSNSVYPGRPMYLGAIIARRNATIVITSDVHLYAVLYNNTAGELDFMKSGVAFHLDGSVRGVPGATTERRYKVLAETDRGYEFLSDELILAAAPTDASFGSNVDVFLTWPRIDGVLRYRVFRHNVVAGTFDELKQITSGSNTYGDNNSVFDAGVGGYPAASDDRVKCYVASPAGDLVDLPVDGVALQWAPLFLNIPVPTPLDKSGTGNQVLRLGLTKALDRQMVDAVSVAASNSISSLTGAFTALDTGRIATLSAPDGTVLHGPEAITFVDATHVTFATNVATSNDPCTLYIVAGGDHGLLIDMIHIGYIPRSAYAPYFEDLNRILFPTAAPNTSSQGGLGTPGDSDDPGDGGITRGCVELSTPVVTLSGNARVSVPFSEIRRGQMLVSGNLTPNTVIDILESETVNLCVVKFENGIELRCSPDHRIWTSAYDTHGTSVSRLERGDSALTYVDGVLETAHVVEIQTTGLCAKVGTFKLAPGHAYIAGRLVLPWWKRLIRRIKGKQGPAGCLSHNLKQLDQF